MATQQHPSPAIANHPHPPSAHQPNGHFSGPPPPHQQPKTISQAVAQINSQTWLQIGMPGSAVSSLPRRMLTTDAAASFSETLGDTEAAISAYENALRHDTWSVPAMSGIASILRDRDQYALAIDYLRSILKVDQANGEVWSHLGKHAWIDLCCAG